MLNCVYSEIYSKHSINTLMKTGLTALLAILAYIPLYGAKLFIPMDDQQTNHLRAYGVVYAAISNGTRVEWLLNYKGGSFVMEYTATYDATCKQKGVSFTQMSNSEYATIIKKVTATGFNGDVVLLDKVPKIAVYTPSGKKPWDDAVTLALTYAGIPFDKLYVSEVLEGKLNKYDWLHLHHEDFTGQYGKFWAQYKDAPWYLTDCRETQQLAAKNKFRKVSQMQLAVVKKIRDFVAAGGNLFAMCSATDTYDIALAANGVDICDTPFDGDAIDPAAQTKLNFKNCFAFTNFTISTNRYEYEYSTIDNTSFRFLPESTDYFSLMPFPAKFDPVPTMLCQNHTKRIKGFMGQTTSFRKEALKPDVVILGERKDVYEARYIHGKYLDGTWTFYGGHDPEDYQHIVGEPPTDLDKFPNSPGYRLILNNVLCLASGKKDVPAVVISESKNAAPAPREISTNYNTPASAVKITAGSANNTLVIAMAGANGKNTLIEQVTFVNNAGKEILSKQYNAPKVTVDMDSLPAGMYNIKVNGIYAGKVVKD